jgi:hypothetical protein
MASTYGSLSNIRYPENIQELKEYIKRKLGHPVVKIDVTDEQMYDRIADTLSMYKKFHYNSTQREYVKWQLTQTDIDNKYLTTSPNITGIVRVLDPQTSNSSSMFTSVEFWLRAQINFGEFFGSTQSSFVEYFLTQQRIADMDQLFRSNPHSRFSTHEKKLFISIDWANDVKVGDWIVAECHVYLDPQTSKGILGESFVLGHSTAGVKMQWGSNLKKFAGVSLPGGLSIDGQSIYNEGFDEMKAIEESLHNDDLMLMPMIG